MPGIPQSFLKLFFTASHNTEDLMAELEQPQVNIESVKRILEIATNDMEALETETYDIVQYATLTEQLLNTQTVTVHLMSVSKRPSTKRLKFLKKSLTIRHHLKKISQALKLLNQGLQTVL